jgi:hypothetical protein
VNQAVDVTIKAMNASGWVIVDYDGFVFVDLLPSSSSASLSYDDYTVPWEGLIIFEPGDLWQKTLSKSLIVRKPGSYILRVYDLDDERVSGQRDIVVWQLQQSAATPISIIAPTVWGIETVSAVTVLANAPWLSNSPFQLLVNGIPSVTWTTNAQWAINAVITGLQEWLNSLQIRIVDLNNIVLGQSETMSFTYQPSTDEFFYGMQILPSTQTKQWDKLVFTVSTSDAVSSVELLLWTGTAIPMDRESAWKFVKQVLIEPKGILPVSLRLNAWGNMKLYQDVASLTIQENTAIWLIKFYTEAVDRSSITMMWQVLWQASKFLIRYGTNKDNLTQEMAVETNEIQISNIVPTSVYYFQITPLDQNGNVIWTPSEIKEIDPSMLQAQVTCIVDWITLRTEQIDGKYYFVRDAIENAEKYIIYRSDTMTSILSEMRKVWETMQTRFEYPFNKDALSEEFAYYAVVAVCANGKEIIIDEVKKVEVGPYDSLLLAIVGTLFVYSIWLLYRRA